MKREFSRYCSAPVQPTRFFLSKEAEEEFKNADPKVQKVAMHLLDACVKQKMEELAFDMIAKKLDELETRIKELEK